MLSLKWVPPPCVYQDTTKEITQIHWQDIRAYMSKGASNVPSLDDFHYSISDIERYARLLGEVFSVFENFPVTFTKLKCNSINPLVFQLKFSVNHHVVKTFCISNFGSCEQHRPYKVSELMLRQIVLFALLCLHFGLAMSFDDFLIKSKSYFVETKTGVDQDKLNQLVASLLDHEMDQKLKLKQQILSLLKANSNLVENVFGQLLEENSEELIGHKFIQDGNEGKSLVIRHNAFVPLKRKKVTMPQEFEELTPQAKKYVKKK